MFEPSPELPPPPPPAPRLPQEGRALRLLADVRAAQTRALQSQGALLAIAIALLLFVLGAWAGAFDARLGLAVMGLGAVAALALVIVFSVVLPRRRVGDDARTARTLAAQLPELNLDLLAAVELSKALGTRQDFSPELARAFLRDVDARAQKLSVGKLIDARPTQRAAMALVGTVFAVLALLVVRGAQIRAGLVLALMPSAVAEPLRRQPITGDVELTYRYPVHTGLPPQTVPSSTGDVSAPAGTEVSLKTRADRDVDEAALVMNTGAKVPMQVKGRELSASFVITESGAFHVAFLDGRDTVAEGPDQSITVEVDQPPQVQIKSPAEAIELEGNEHVVHLVYEASDDYGLSKLELVFTPPGKKEQRVSLKPDEGRITRGTYDWDLAPLALQEGQRVTYFLEATDNDGVKGAKRAVSATHTVSTYSSAQHRRDALEKAEALWTRLVDHLAERMESPERTAPASVDDALAGKPSDERATQLAQDLSLLARSLADAPEPQDTLISALVNIGAELTRDTQQVTTNRNFLLQLTGRIASGKGTRGTTLADSGGVYVKDLQRRLPQSIALDVTHSEKNVLYLESLLDRERLQAIKDLAKELRDDRQELSRLLDEAKRAPDSVTQQQLLDQMERLNARMQALQQRMQELMKGMRDDFINQEALQQMQEEMGLQTSMSDIEKAIREGNIEDALKKMAELSMSMDEFLESLDKAEEEADQQQDPELARQFEDFQDTLKDTIEQQQQVADKTRALRDKYRAQQKERIAQKGEQLKKELSQKLDELQSDWKAIDPSSFGFSFDDERAQALSHADNVKQALSADDFGLATESADEMERRARDMAADAEEQRRREELFQNPAEARRQTQKTAEKLARDAKKAAEVAQKLRDLFPRGGQQMSEPDRQQMSELGKQQQQLQQQARQLQQQMDSINDRAPVFNEDAQQQMDQAAQRMQGAGERLGDKDPSRAQGEEQGALQALRSIQQGLEQAGNGQGKKGGVPLPMRSGMGRGRGERHEKVAIPDEDPNAAPRDFRKDVMDAMKQGAPDRYKDQNKKYYEELVK